MRNSTEKTVLIIQTQIKQYRVPFFEKLHSMLKEDGISLRVAYSDPPSCEDGKGDNCDLPPDYGIKVHAYWAAGQRLVWQPLIKHVAASDLIIVEQANKHLMNHLLVLSSAFHRKKLAFWGLGENKQAGQLAISEWYRRRVLNRPHWWFAYTAGTAAYLQAQGVSQQKITAVQNSVDTQELRKQIASISEERVALEKRALGINPAAPVGVFCGMLDPVKAVPFLIESAKLARREIPQFHLIIAGGGPDARIIGELAAANKEWIHLVGPQFGAGKALVLRMGDFFTLPGRVGLAILDAFAAGLPMLTTDISIHGPEAEYLEQRVNGLKVRHEIGAYASAIVELLTDRPRLHCLKKGAAESAARYSIEAMVRNFHQGITKCLATV